MTEQDTAENTLMVEPGIPMWTEREHETTYGGEDYAELAAITRRFLDALAAARPDPDTMRGITKSLREWSAVLTPMEVEESDQVFAHRTDLPGRGSVMLPAFEVLEINDESLRGRVNFGNFFLGGHGAVHGGAVTLLFDEVFGALTWNSREGSRTAYLHVNYRSITPIDTELSVRASFDRTEGRKLFVSAELRNGDVLCADAEALFLILEPGQE